MIKENISVWKKYILLINLEGCIIIDTGSPMSFHKSGIIRFAGLNHNCSRTLPGIDIEAISKAIDQHVIGLIGMDIMGKYENVIFDYQNNQMLFNDNINYDMLISLPSGNIMGATYVDLMIEGKIARMFMDTGAPTSYISSSFTTGHSSLEKVYDYHPFYGEFTSETYKLTTEVNEHKEIMIFGNLPSVLQMPISMMGADGVIGYEIFKSHKLLYKQSKWYLFG